MSTEAQIISPGALSPAQVRAARAWLGWSQDELANRSHVAKRTIARLESTGGSTHARTLHDLRRAFEEEGLEFLFSAGVATGFVDHRAGARAAVGKG
jgi:transcriptional regulator with XRE-family HTH domain